jgi:hypothetical protein
MLGAEQPVPLSPTTDIPSLDDLPAVPDVSATLAVADPALPAALDRESLEQDAAAVRSVMADVAVVEGVQMFEMDPGSLPLAEDLEVSQAGRWVGRVGEWGCYGGLGVEVLVQWGRVVFVL